MVQVKSWEYMDAWAYKDAAGTVTFDGGNWTVATPLIVQMVLQLFLMPLVYTHFAL